MIFQLKQNIHKFRRDLIICVILAVISGSSVFYMFHLIDPIINRIETQDTWFQGDCGRVFGNMSMRKSDHPRTNVHPLFVLVGGTPIILLNKALGVNPASSVIVYISLIALLWTITLFIILRLIGCRQFDSLLITILGMTSSAAIFWFSVVETYSFGSLSILLVILIVAVSKYKELPYGWYIAISALSLSITVTNWMVGILATFAKFPWRKAVQITIYAFVIVVLFWGLQKGIFSTSEYFLKVRGESEHLLRPESGGFLRILSSFLFHSIVMPEIKVVEEVNINGWPGMVIQHSLPGSGSFWGLIAIALWAVLLALGIWAIWKKEVYPPLRTVIGLTIVGQLGLHLLYGAETFLYSLNFAPLLILMVAFATLTSARYITLLLIGILVLFSGINNIGQYRKAIAFYQTHGTERHKVNSQMKLRPNDPWPRGKGHVILAIPGSKEEEKAYHEPGGSFSPAVNSFGVSFWITDPQGNIKVTSDNIPIKCITQNLSWSDAHQIPGLTTHTSYYQAIWNFLSPGNWRLKFSPNRTSGLKNFMIIRSVGPAGGPINSITWNGESLLINERWSLKIKPLPKEIYLGKESESRWLTEASDLKQVTDLNGWCYARLALEDNQVATINMVDKLSANTTRLINYTSLRSPLELQLPDQRFISCLEAQVAHLMMGLVDGETRPGDPMNYPSSWLRDGAYVTVALARAGKLQEAKQLSDYFAKNDFFGGFGSEADGPGLALWALDEVATQLNEPEFDKQLWPHVNRKTNFISEMLSNKFPIYKPWSGDIVPDLFLKIKKGLINTRDQGGLWLLLVAEPAMDGLIIGKMDNQLPLLYVNAVNFRGLLAAASIADRLGHGSEAYSWQNQAKELQKAWLLRFSPPESLNDRTYICGLWPTGIAEPIKDKFYEKLLERWKDQRDANGKYRNNRLWTYFDLAEAHQWLFLDQSDRVWKTLNWYWENQASPGLYTWWQGNREENSFNRWENIRGWINPQCVTPHYWTAAEMLLLQLDMLSYLVETKEGPVIVIGAGIPQTWLRQPMKVHGLRLSKRNISWDWDGERMLVQIRGSTARVRLGSPFPPNTPVVVKYIN